MLRPEATLWVPARTLRFIANSALYPKSAKHAFLQNAILIALYFFFAAARPSPILLLRTLILLIFVAEVPWQFAPLIHHLRRCLLAEVPRIASLGTVSVLFVSSTLLQCIQIRAIGLLLLFPACFSLRSAQRLLDELILRIRATTRSAVSGAWNSEASWYVFDIIWNETVIALGLVLLPFVLYWVYRQLMRCRAWAVWICIWLTHLVAFSFSLEMLIPVLPLYVTFSALSIHLILLGLGDGFTTLFWPWHWAS